ncbi:beta-actin [Oopsacas minuta]|uniref:Beta-actin n=1 Tax=Oopsacas minuta TaxID=111878 RepID=A0AAV7JD51_9METZ|nr:beta-actin [Oopsacas minuta]
MALKDISSSTIVIDNGSGTLKSGLAGTSTICTVPSMVGRPRHSGVMVGMWQNGRPFTGFKCKKFRGIVTTKYPIQHIVISNWDDMETLWKDTIYNELHLEPKEHSMLLTEPPLNPLRNREKMTEIMFEAFEIPALLICTNSILSLFASGRTTGLVIDSGDGASYTVPIFKNHSLNNAVIRSDINGRDITGYMMKILEERGYTLATTPDRDIVNDIKEKLGYVALDFEEEMNKKYSQVNRHYELNSGIITIGNERFRCAEPIFNPSYLGMSIAGLQDTAYHSIMKCDVEIRNYLFSNIVLSGGNTMFPGMRERMQRDIQQLAPKGVQVNVISPPERHYSAWRGGAMLAKMDNFLSMCITSQEYNEIGPWIVHRKCL